MTNTAALVAVEAQAEVNNVVRRILEDALQGRPANAGTVKRLARTLRDYADMLDVEVSA